jgi:hypothetical protein
MIVKLIKQGSIIIKPQFLNQEQYYFSLSLFENRKFTETYQPSEVYYGNRFQAYPCYQYILNEEDNRLFENLISRELNQEITLKTIARKIYTEELKKSKCNTKYGYIHEDDADIAGVLPFDQSVDGGTAFFENPWDKVPDISVGSYKNRLILYNSKRNHAPCQDFTFTERKVLAFMIYLK